MSSHVLSLFTNSHDEMKTQWEHPKTGKKKRCAGGLRYLVDCHWLHMCLLCPNTLILIFLVYENSNNKPNQLFYDHTKLMNPRS